MQTLSDLKRKARTAHRCQLCLRVIYPGETYTYQTIVGDDGIYVWKNCAHCEQLMLFLWVVDPWLFDEGITWHDVSGWQPDSIAQMRWKVYWQNEWRRPDGTLREVPILETGNK